MRIVGYRRVIGARLLILATFASLPILVGRESKKSGQGLWEERVLGVRNRDA